MANKTIYNLGNSTVPLVGTEVIPLWDGAATKKVTVDNLTAGKHVDTADLYAVKTSAGAVVDVVTVQNLSSNAGTEAGVFLAPTSATGNIRGARITAHNDGSNVIKLKFYTGIGAAITEKYDLSSDGNLVPLVAAKGINFTANTPAAGMTSQLLNWYEEGTWTPNQGAGLTVVGAFSSSGTYTRIGRQVTVRGQMVGATSVAVVAAGVMSSNLPYVASVSHAGSMFNSAVTTSGVVQITSSSVVAATTIAATPNITFTATYTV